MTWGNLPMASVGAGAGVYDTTRQVAAALGGATVAALVSARLAANGLPGDAGAPQESDGSAMPPDVADRFSLAMAQAYWLSRTPTLPG